MNPRLRIFDSQREYTHDLEIAAGAVRADLETLQARVDACRKSISTSRKRIAGVRERHPIG